MDKITLSIILLVLISQVVLALGTSNPVPTNIEIAEGKSERFVYQVQAGDIPIICDEEVTESGGLEIEFDETEKIAASKESINVYGTVKAPPGIEGGKHIATFCVVCKPQEIIVEGTGSSIEFRNCDLPINVEVVGQRTRENNPLLQQKPFKIPQIPFYYYLIIIAILIIIIVWYKYEKGKGEWTTVRRKL